MRFPPILLPPPKLSRPQHLRSSFYLSHQPFPPWLLQEGPCSQIKRRRWAHCYSWAVAGALPSPAAAFPLKCAARQAALIILRRCLPFLTGDELSCRMDPVPPPTAPAMEELPLHRGAKGGSRLPRGDGRLEQDRLGESMLHCIPLLFFSTLPCPPCCTPCCALPPAPFLLFSCFLALLWKGELLRVI